MSSPGAMVTLVTRSASRSASHRASLGDVPEQFAIRMSDELARALDELVSSGRFATRAEAVRAAVEGLLDAERRRQIDQRILEGYAAIPQTDAEVASATQAAIASIEEEPW